MMDLVDAPRDISFFKQTHSTREIIYRLLQGEVREHAFARLPRLEYQVPPDERKAVAWLRSNYEKAPACGEHLATCSLQA